MDNLRLTKKWLDEHHVVLGDRVFKKNKAGRKHGKPLPKIKLLSSLAEYIPELEHDMGMATDLLDEAIEKASAAQKAMSPDVDLQKVDDWVVPLLQAFRWRSTGETMAIYFIPDWAQKLAGGEHPDEIDFEHRVVPCSNAEDSVATMLQSWPRWWDAYVRIYEQACSDDEIYVTPKSVKEGRKSFYDFRSYLKQMQIRWISDSRFRMLEEPKQIANSSDEWAFYHFLPGMIPKKGKETPTWNSWLAKMPTDEHREIFMAWIMSIFVAKNESRQLMWIHDNGGGGKGVIAKVLTKFMGDYAVGAIGKSMLESQFGASSAYGKRLMIHGDNKNDRILSTTLIHQITSGDRIPVEKKNQQSFPAWIYAKCLIMANCGPDADMYNLHERSRLLYTTLDPFATGADTSHLVRDASGTLQLKGDPTFEPRLLKEMPDFLAKCRTAYVKLCPHHGNIETTVIHNDYVAEKCASTQQMQYETFFDENFECMDNVAISIQDLQDLYEEEFGKGRNGIQAFKKYIATFGVDIKRVRVGEERVRVYAGMRLKGQDGIQVNYVSTTKNS